MRERLTEIAGQPEITDLALLSATGLVERETRNYLAIRPLQQKYLDCEFKAPELRCHAKATWMANMPRDRRAAYIVALCAVPDVKEQRVAHQRRDEAVAAPSAQYYRSASGIISSDQWEAAIAELHTVEYEWCSSPDAKR
jgi:hypothetical protein